MKTILRIPTIQYGYIELESTVESAEEAIIKYNQIVELYKKSQNPITRDHEKAIKFANSVAKGEKEVYE